MTTYQSVKTSHYFCLGETLPKNSGYHLTSIRHEDIFIIKNWRNDQMDILRQDTVLTDEEQRQYFNERIFPDFVSKNPKNILLSYFHESKLIGYGGFVHIDWESKRSEISFLSDPLRAKNPETYKKDFLVFLSLIKELAKNQLHFQRLFTETYDVRPLHTKCLEESGFLFEGRMRNHVMVSGKLTDSLIHGCLLE